MSTSSTTAKNARVQEVLQPEMQIVAEELRREFQKDVHLQGAAGLLAREVREFQAEVDRPQYQRSRSRMSGTLERIQQLARMIGEGL